MKLKKILVCFLLICAVPLSNKVSAITVGEETSFVANVIEETFEETQNSNTRTEEQKNKDEHNRNNYREVRSLKKDWVKTLDKETVPTYFYTDGIMTVAINGPLETIKLETIVERTYYPDSRDYDVDDYDTDYEEIELTEEQETALRNEYDNHGMDLDEAAPSDELDWNPIYENTPQFTIYDHWISNIITGGGKPIKQIGGTAYIFDCETYVERYKLVESYIDSIRNSTEVETTYILEIRAESVVENGLYSSIPQTWYNTGATHFWQIEYINGENAIYHAPINAFGGNTHSQTFYLPGDYRVSATQVLENTYSNAITYSINEYWVLAETGLVIWSHESQGVTLNPEELKPLSELGIEQIVYYDEPRTQEEYVTVFDETIQVTSDGISEWDGPFGNPGVWGYEFTTERIQ